MPSRRPSRPRPVRGGPPDPPEGPTPRVDELDLELHDGMFRPPSEVPALADDRIGDRAAAETRKPSGPPPLEDARGAVPAWRSAAPRPAPAAVHLPPAAGSILEPLDPLDALHPLREWPAPGLPGLVCVVRQLVTGALTAEVWRAAPRARVAYRVLSLATVPDAAQEAATLATRYAEKLAAAGIDPGSGEPCAEGSGPGGADDAPKASGRPCS